MPSSALGIAMTFPPAPDDRTRIDARVRAGRGVPPHVHPRQEEVFRVLEGEVDLLVGVRRRRLRAGDEARVPAGTAHGFRAVTEARMLNDFVPGLGTEESFRALFGLVHDAPRRPLGALLDLAVLSAERPLEAFYLPGLPWRAQAAAWRVAGAAARRLGGRRPG